MALAALVGVGGSLVAPFAGLVDGNSNSTSRIRTSHTHTHTHTQTHALHSTPPQTQSLEDDGANKRGRRCPVHGRRHPAILFACCTHGRPGTSTHHKPPQATTPPQRAHPHPHPHTHHAQAFSLPLIPAGRAAPLTVRHGSLPPYDSAFSQPEEEKNFWGNDYVPKQQHPGTMPPGTRLEDKPIEELSPVSNIPYPHFQEWPFHYRFPAYQPRRMDFIEWMTMRGLMVEDDGDTRGVRFLGRKRRFRAQKAQADKAAAEGSDPMSPDERKQALEGIDGDYWRSEGAELVAPEEFIFEQASQKRFRIPYIVGVREEKAAKLAAEAAALGGAQGDGGVVGGAAAAGKPAKGRKAKPPPTAEI